MISELLSELKAIRARVGYSEFDAAIKKLGRERLQNPAREKRVTFSPSIRLRLFERQNGICACGCGEHLSPRIRTNHVDHKDPNRQDFNHISNLQLLIPAHNLTKSSSSIEEQSKRTGRTFTDLIDD